MHAALHQAILMGRDGTLQHGFYRRDHSPVQTPSKNQAPSNQEQPEDHPNQPKIVLQLLAGQRLLQEDDAERDAEGPSQPPQRAGSRLHEACVPAPVSSIKEAMPNCCELA
jgi:hypothetical protein